MDRSQLEQLLDDPDELAKLVAKLLPDSRFDPDEPGELRERVEKLLQARPPKFGGLLERLGEDEAERKARRAERKAEREERRAKREQRRGEPPPLVRQRQLEGEHTLYLTRARHHRVAPYEADWTGDECQSVRVTLPQSPDAEAEIWTYLGVVKASDHLIFSVDEVVDAYQEAFGSRPSVARVDLITGARHLDLDRFSPISIFLAFASTEDSQPSFYFLEAGSAQGSPEALYPARAMAEGIHTTCDFSFTPFACKSNWYTGELSMSSDGTEPARIVNVVSQEKDGQRHYLTLTADYSVIEPGRVNLPVAAQAEAVLRVCALAQGMGVATEIEELLGDCARETLEWAKQPPREGEADGYDGCP